MAAIPSTTEKKIIIDFDIDIAAAATISIDVDGDTYAYTVPADTVTTGKLIIDMQEDDA